MLWSYLTVVGIVCVCVWVKWKLQVCKVLESEKWFTFQLYDCKMSWCCFFCLFFPPMSYNNEQSHVGVMKLCGLFKKKILFFFASTHVRPLHYLSSWYLNYYSFLYSMFRDYQNTACLDATIWSEQKCLFFLCILIGKIKMKRDEKFVTDVQFTVTVLQPNVFPWCLWILYIFI